MTNKSCSITTMKVASAQVESKVVLRIIENKKRVNVCQEVGVL